MGTEDAGRFMIRLKLMEGALCGEVFKELWLSVFPDGNLVFNVIDIKTDGSRYTSPHRTLELALDEYNRMT